MKDIPIQQTRPDMIGREWKIRDTRRSRISAFVITETPATRAQARTITQEYRDLGHLCEWRDYRRVPHNRKLGIVVLVNPYPEERIYPQR